MRVFRQQEDKFGCFVYNDSVKIVGVKNLALPEVLVIDFERFLDHRGYFTETYREEDFAGSGSLGPLKTFRFEQVNESHSKNQTIRGLHFQWNPYMGKLVRVIEGRMLDIVCDIRKNSPNFGKIILWEMAADQKNTTGQWIWVPPGFAHGTLFLKESTIEYFCTGHYNPNCEACISPLAVDFDWSLCDKKLKAVFDEVSAKTKLISEKDKNGFSLAQWSKNPSSDNFVYQK